MNRIIKSAPVTLSRRGLITSTAALAAASALPVPAWAKGGSMHGHEAKKGFGTYSGQDIRLNIGHAKFSTGGRSGHAIAVDGMIPGPLIRLKEGQNVRLHV
ncbi:MAG: copper resistance system multicopper oxidase, partial [Qipengyuania vulgaris]